MARRFVFDSNVLRYASSHPDFGAEVRSRYHPLSYSVVVLSELRRAARNEQALRTLNKLAGLKPPLLFAPTIADWMLTAEYLATLLPPGTRTPSQQLKDLIRNAQNDALIAFSTWRMDFVLVTCDRDFAPILAQSGIAVDRLVTLQAP